MMDWVDLEKVKPILGQDVLIFRHWESSGKFYSDYILASYVKNPYDKRRNCFIPKQDKLKKTPLFITRITHWMPLPPPPEKITDNNIPETNAASMVGELFGSSKKYGE